MFFYIKALHLLFVVTWFSGLFYIVRLFVYSSEANDKPSTEREILLSQFAIMQKRLWYGITWPSAILTLLFGTWLAILYNSLPMWLMIKIGLVIGLFLYHITLHRIFLQQQRYYFKWNSQQLRFWNEVATLFLICIIMLAVVKQLLSLVWGLVGLGVFTLSLLLAIHLYKKYRST